MSTLDKLQEEIGFPFNYVIVGVIIDEEREHIKLMHSVWYEHEPTDDDMNALMEELQYDPEHGLVEIMNQLEFFVIDRKTFEEIWTYDK